VNVVDPQIADMIEDEARATLRDRFVDLWYAEDQSCLVLGVFAPTGADMAFLRELTSTHLLAAIELPVSRAEVDAAVDRAWDEAGDDALGAGPDYKTGRVELGVTWSQVGRVIERINAENNGLLAVEFNEAIPESKPGQVVVMVGPAEPMEFDEGTNSRNDIGEIEEQ